MITIRRLVATALCVTPCLASAGRIVRLPSSAQVATQEARISALRRALGEEVHASSTEARARSIGLGVSASRFVGAGLMTRAVTVRAAGRQQKLRVVTLSSRVGLGADALLGELVGRYEAAPGTAPDGVVPRFELAGAASGGLLFGGSAAYGRGWSRTGGRIATSSFSKALGFGIWAGVQLDLNLRAEPVGDQASPPLRWAARGLRVADVADAALANGDHVKAEKAISVMKRALERAHKNREAFAAE